MKLKHGSCYQYDKTIYIIEKVDYDRILAKPKMIYYKIFYYTKLNRYNNQIAFVKDKNKEIDNFCMTFNDWNIFINVNKCNFIGILHETIKLNKFSLTINKKYFKKV